MRFVLFILFLLPGFYSKAGNIDSLFKIFSSGPDKNKKSDLIIQFIENNTGELGDSEWDKVIGEVRSVNNPALLIKAYVSYFNALNPRLSKNKALARAGEMLDLAKSANNDEWYYHAYSAFSKTHEQFGETDKAEEFIIKAYYHVTLLENEILRAKCMMQYGGCQEQNNKKIDAFRNYLNALYLGEKNNDPELIFESYGHLSSFYFQIANDKQAKEFKLKQIEMVSSKATQDSGVLMRLYSNLADLLYYTNEREEADKLTRTIVEYSTRREQPDLTNPTIIARSTYLIKHGYMKELAEMFTNEYPGYLANIRQTDEIMYYWLQAYIQEVDKRTDSSHYYYSLIEEQYPKSQYANNLILQSNFYKRFAQFFLRQNKLKEAVQKMERSYELAKKVGYVPYLIETTGYLDSLYFLGGDVNKAYGFSRLNNAYYQQQMNTNKEEDILLLKIDNEARQAELRKAREEEQTARRYDLQYMGIILLIATSFLLLGTLGRFKMPQWSIRTVGFVSFIFFFEFIVLLADNKIHHATHGEPWKVMAIKSVLIGFLFPLHHWMENKALRFLTSDSKISIQNSIKKILAKNKTEDLKRSATKKQRSRKAGTTEVPES